ncbi:hypothetical protein NDI85_21185 [Halomicroarcula sp. S1AR25-4]|uniref:hypothetical protein n=1 Tax=Haloarcula sp. S1AR25-4 TaxID=2950538 RepID=UPI002875E012|nr:hypothetical protein [Halomicroarcula sp. S1AR25-4]MDS0280302.1 hypothetical protein [Halomicroarcula sp. S1AR25-4]
MTGTFNETHFDFAEEIDRLDDRIADLQAEADETEDGSDQEAALLETIQTLQTQRKGAIWACPGRGGGEDAHEDDDFPMWDEPVDGVTLGAVRARTFANMENDLESDPNAGSGTSSILLIADGTVEAPYVGEDMRDAEIAGAVGKLHPWYLKWAEGRITALMDPEGNATSSGTSPGDKPTKTTSTEE